MRCYMCDGRGMRYDGFQNLYRTCERCGGSGIAEPLTNEEYIRSCSTEELPKALKEMFFDIKSRVRSELGGYNELMKSERYFDEWLKEKHDEVS